MPSAKWKCPECGTGGNEDGNDCRGCGHRLLRPLTLVREDGQAIPSNIDLRCNQSWARRMLGDDGKFWDPDWQLSFVRGGDGWMLVPNASAQNETLVNGGAAASEVRLRDGDVVAVGRAARGVSKTPLRVRLG